MQKYSYYERMNWELDIDPQIIIKFCQNFPCSQLELKTWFESKSANLIPLRPILPEDDFETLVGKVTKIIFGRIFLLQSDKIGNDFQLTHLMLFISKCLPIAIEDRDEVKLLFLFNCSRGMVDTKESLQRLLKYLTEFSEIQSFNPYPFLTETNLLSDAFGYFKKVLNNKGVKIALQTFIDDQLTVENGYPNNVTVENCIDVLQKMEVEIIPSEHLFNGMIGRGKKIYINFGRIFTSCEKDNEKTKACFVKLFFHEGGHELIRSFGKNGYSSFTARGKAQILENLEAGYRIEKLIFGPFKKKYWLCGNFFKILKKKNYAKLPIFSDPQEIDLMIDRKIAEFCSGICAVEQSLDFCTWE